MKKEDKEIRLLDSDIILNKGLTKESFKTTNINILLNRVRLSKKKTFKKRIMILFVLVTIITALSVYFTTY